MGQSMDVCHCIATVGSEDKDDLRSIEKFKLHTIDFLDKSTLPQSITARVAPADDILICPASEKECVYYHIIAEELVINGKDQNGDAIKKWEYRFDDSKSVDFYLADPQSPDTLVFVPGKSTEIRSHNADIEDGANRETTLDDPTLLTFGPSVDTPPGLKAIAAAKKFDLYKSAGMFSLARKVKKEIRYSVFSIEMNEQIAILAVISDDKEPQKTFKTKIASPVSKDSLSPEYFRQYSWSDQDMLSWRALTGDRPCVLVTKDPRFFQGAYVKSVDYEPTVQGSETKRLRPSLI